MTNQQAFITLLLFWILLSPIGSKAQDNMEPHALRLGMTISQSYGDTRYELRAQAEDPMGGGGLVDIRSQLKFPVDATLLGIMVQWTPGYDRLRHWALDTRIGMSVTNPDKKMTDEDWIGSKQIALTESRPELDMIIAEVDVAYHLRPGRRTAFDVVLHVDYQRTEQHLIGFEGWRGTLFSDQRFPVSGTYPVLDYKVQYVSPQLGAAVSYRGIRHLRLGAQASAGMVYASDTDDHLLRGRISEGSGWGFGSSSRMELTLESGFLWLSWLSVSLTGELRFFHTEGNTDQRWYRDEDLPAGTEINDIPYEIESLQGQIGVHVGVSF